MATSPKTRKISVNTHGSTMGSRLTPSGLRTSGTWFRCCCVVKKLFDRLIGCVRPPTPRFRRGQLHHGLKTCVLRAMAIRLAAAVPIWPFMGQSPEPLDSSRGWNFKVVPFGLLVEHKNVQNVGAAVAAVPAISPPVTSCFVFITINANLHPPNTKKTIDTTSIHVIQNCNINSPCKALV